MKKINLLLFIACSFLIASCADDALDSVKDNGVINSENGSFERMTEGNNPYSVDNMKLAYQYLIEQGRLNPENFPGFEIKPTHKYIKLNPSTLEEEDQIAADTTFIALDYPLDLDLPETYFEERGTLEEDQIPEYYSSIKMDQHIAYTGNLEVITKMYVPEEDPYFEESDEDYSEGSEIITTKAQLHDELLFTAYFFKGLEYLLNEDRYGAKGTNLEDNKPQQPVLTTFDNKLVLDDNSEKRFNDLIIKPLGIGKKWYPSGRIMYTDNSLPANTNNPSGLEHVYPLPGAQILLRQGVTMRQAITDASGNFSTSKLRGHARYIIQWERAKYNIKKKGLWQAELRGPKKGSAWHHMIQDSDKEDTYHALIHMACLDYYYSDRFGLVAPKNNIRIAARQATEPASNHVAARGIFYQISITKWGDRHSDIYGTTIHELAHSAHRQVSSHDYDALVEKAILTPSWLISDSQKKEARTMLETWPTTVELLFIQRRYGLVDDVRNGVQDLHNKYRQLMQNTQIGMADGQQKQYTSCGFDMIDDFNQNDRITPNTNLPIDRVTGYTPAQLERALVMTQRWNAWRDRIKQQNTNNTSQFLDELFANWTF